MLLKDKNLNSYPVLIEYKGHRNKLVKLNSDNQVFNFGKDNETVYKNIKEYAVNGAVHYANAILHYTNYTNVIAIGITGYKDELSENKIISQISVYLVSKSNFGLGQKIGDYSDLSFLKQDHFDNFIESAKEKELSPEEKEKIKKIKEEEIDKRIKK